ncbi:MAG TPA: nuclear transport factor 2 family protein [Casimicrobiaceae bacterium]
MRGTRHLSLAAAALLLGACTTAPTYPDSALEDLFDAERAFAREATERGIRAAFLDYFAADGVDFRPGPGVMRERMLARPAPADPLALVLDWSPQAGAVARAGDLGFTTGPYSLRNQRDPGAPTRYGYFLSVWKREAGRWRVAVDAGVAAPGAPPPESSAATASGAPGPAAPLPRASALNRGKDALLALEREAWSLDPNPEGAVSYFELLANSVRILREDSYALIGADAATRRLAATGRRLRWTPAGAGASASDDLGFTYGRYARFVGGAEEANGYYIHVWQRDDTGAWRIAAEVLLPPG